MDSRRITHRINSHRQDCIFVGWRLQEDTEDCLPAGTFKEERMGSLEIEINSLCVCWEAQGLSAGRKNNV